MAAPIRFHQVAVDAKYFERTLTLAQQGNADEQTLIGCCYGHVGTQAPVVVQRDEKKALEWWMKAAKQNHKYAMRELALYYWHKGNVEEAMKWHKGPPDLYVISQSAKQAQRQELAEYETKTKNSSQQFVIIHDLHAGDVIYEKLTIRLGCVYLRVLSEPVRVEIDENTTCWDFTAELLERKLYKWNKESLDIERISVEFFEEDNKYKNYRLCEQVANGRPKLHRKNPFELEKGETDILIWPPFNMAK